MWFLLLVRGRRWDWLWAVHHSGWVRLGGCSIALAILGSSPTYFLYIGEYRGSRSSADHIWTFQIPAANEHPEPACDSNPHQWAHILDYGSHAPASLPGSQHICFLWIWTLKPRHHMRIRIPTWATAFLSPVRFHLALQARLLRHSWGAWWSSDLEVRTSSRTSSAAWPPCCSWRPWNWSASAISKLWWNWMGSVDRGWRESCSNWSKYCHRHTLLVLLNSSRSNSKAVW